ncbi:MAG: DUF1501 domain-containing protein [Acetobacteraceae bacterium]
MVLTRRNTLLGLSAVIATGPVRLALAAAETSRRFVVVLLRGALDGLSAVVPYGDPHLRPLRAGLVPADPERPGGLLDLGGFYGLDPALGGVHAMYREGAVLPVHAIAGPYRTRSHFEAQDLLQTGGMNASITSGWLNRVVAELSGAGPDVSALAVGMGMPLLLRGQAPVGSYAPARFATPSPDLYRRIAALNQPDPLLGPAIARGLHELHFDQEVLDPDGEPERAIHRGYGFPELAAAAGKLLADPEGPRIAAFQLEGWDTHASQVALLHGPLAGLDAGLVMLRKSLGEAWQQTMVLVITEFGRTARMNGTHGTDHGTATVAFLLGGRVAGGRVRGTWPGLGPDQLFQNRDLAPTADIRALAKGALGEQFGLSQAALSRVFPESGAAEPMTGLLRS